MKRKLKKLKKELERAGGLVYFAPEIPDDIARSFLDEILNCPDCAERTPGSKRTSTGDVREP